MLKLETFLLVTMDKKEGREGRKKNRKLLSRIGGERSHIWQLEFLLLDDSSLVSIRGNLVLQYHEKK